LERRRIDLKRLPRWLQYVIALTVTAVVVALAWHVGKDRPVPHWIQAYLVPALGWVGLILLVTGVLAWVLKKEKSWRVRFRERRLH